MLNDYVIAKKEAAGWRYLTPHGWVVTKTCRTSGSQSLHPAVENAPSLREILNMLCAAELAAASYEPFTEGCKCSTCAALRKIPLAIAKLTALEEKA
jgi:hypothetical protein